MSKLGTIKERIKTGNKDAVDPKEVAVRNDESNPKAKAIFDAYVTYLGREPSPEEVQGHLDRGTNEPTENLVNSIMSSPEALTHAKDVLRQAYENNPYGMQGTQLKKDLELLDSQKTIDEGKANEFWTNLKNTITTNTTKQTDATQKLIDGLSTTKTTDLATANTELGGLVTEAEGRLAKLKETYGVDSEAYKTEKANLETLYAKQRGDLQTAKDTDLAEVKDTSRIDAMIAKLKGDLGEGEKSAEKADQMEYDYYGNKLKEELGTQLQGARETSNARGLGDSTIATGQENQLREAMLRTLGGKGTELAIAKLKRESDIKRAIAEKEMDLTSKSIDRENALKDYYRSKGLELTSEEAKALAGKMSEYNAKELSQRGVLEGNVDTAKTNLITRKQNIGDTYNANELALKNKIIEQMGLGDTNMTNALTNEYGNLSGIRSGYDTRAWGMKEGAQNRGYTDYNNTLGLSIKEIDDMRQRIMDDKVRQAMENASKKGTWDYLLDVANVGSKFV